MGIQKASDPITLDGKLDEASWHTTQPAADFYMNFPADTAYAKSKTEVRITYNEQFLYIAAICYDELPGNLVLRSLRRDFDLFSSDGFTVFIDPFDDKVNGFSFGVSPLGVQREGLIQNGGSFGESISWDNRWFAEVLREPGKWTVEMAIPFKTLRYNDDLTYWGINFTRIDLKRNEVSVWSPVPRNFEPSALAYTGKMNWDLPPKKAGSNISLIPSATGGLSHNYEAEEGEEATTHREEVSMDAKVAVTSSLNLDLTINPDFSQVEVDQQQTNLTRFSLFFPERRAFFLENSDLFERFGFRQIRPFFSRRIGLKDGSPIRIYGGARLSGKVNRNWRIGIMNLQTASDTSVNEKSHNYTVAAVQRQVFGRSSISGIFVNRQSFDDLEAGAEDYDRVAGIDFNLASNDNTWQGKVFYHQAFTPENPVNDYAHASWLMFNTRKIFWMWNHEYVGRDYKPAVGFTPRNRQFDPALERTIGKTYWRLEPEFQYRIYPENSAINRHSMGVYLDQYLDKDLETTDYRLRGYYQMSFVNSSDLEVRVEELYTHLFFDTDVTFSDNAAIPAGDYNYRSTRIQYTSNVRKTYWGSFSLNYGSYYNGELLGYNAEVSYRKQPWGIFSLSLNRNQINLPEQYDDAYLTLVGTRVELSFTKSLFLTTFLQYNTQVDNLNVNTRFQWRFRPMSDLYLVYTDNYDQYLGVKNRALALKFIYWITL